MARKPSAALVVDANVILSAVLGRRSRPAFDDIVSRRTVLTSARVAEEVRSVLACNPDFGPEAVEPADTLLLGLLIVDQSIYADLAPAAARVLRRAVASRNGSGDDDHVLACAWIFDADVWPMRDFAGTGWPSWSNANLYDSLLTDDGPLAAM